jgi:nucleoprotein TPR
MGTFFVAARQVPSATTARTVTSQAKLMERRAATASAVSRPTEVRKPGRRLVRPALERTEEVHTDTEMPTAEAPGATEEVKVSIISHEPEAPPSSASLLRKHAPSSEPREDFGTQEAAIDISEAAAAPPQKKQKVTTVSQENTQDTESTLMPAAPAIPASPETPEGVPESVVPAENVDAPVNAEEMDADLLGREEVIEVIGEEELTNKDEMELEGKNQEEEQQLETDAMVTALEEGEAEQNILSEGEDDREEGELPLEPDQLQDDLPGEGNNPESTLTCADDTEETLELASLEPAAEPGEITEEGNEGAENADEAAKSNEEAPPVIAPVIQKSPRRIVRLLRGSSSSTVRRSSENDSAAADNQGSGAPSTETEATEAVSRGRTIHLPQRARENAVLRQAGISPQPAGRGRGQGQSGPSNRV